MSRLVLCANKFDIDPEEYAVDVDAKLKDDILAAKQAKITAQLQAVALNDAHTAVANMAATRFDNNYARAVQAFLTNSDLRTGGASVEFMVNATVADAKRELSGLADEMFRSNWKKFIGNAELDDALNEDVFLALRGVAPQSELAGKISRSFRDTAEKLRVEFNKAGGAIRKLDDWAMPQGHVPRKMMRGIDISDRTKILDEQFAEARDRWVDYIMPRLDRSRMQDNAGNALDDADLRELLGKTFGKIVYDGDTAIDIEKLKLPSGKRVAKRHADHRVLHFRGPQEALEYAREYGTDNVVEVMVNHLDSMARDLALIREMGPNPDTTFQTLKKAAVRQSGLQGGRWNVVSAGGLDATWNTLKGFDNPANPKWSALASNMRAVVSTARLGFATITSIPDIASGWATIVFNGGSGGRYIMRRVKQLVPLVARADKAEAMRYGLFIDNTIAAMRVANRYTDDELGSKMRMMSNAFYNFTLMTPFQAGQEVATRLSMLDTVGTIANRLDAGLPLNRRQQAFMRRYGLDPDDMARLYEHYDYKTQLIDMDAIDDDALRMRINSAILEESNYGAPAPTARSRAITTAGKAGGDPWGEAARFVTQWKSFMIILNQTALARIKNTALNRHDLGMGFNAGYIMAYASAMTALGVVAYQTKMVLRGQEPAPMDTPQDMAKVTMAGFLQAGVGGVFADYIFSKTNRYGKGFTESLFVPPTIQYFDDLFGNMLMTDFDSEASAQDWWDAYMEKLDKGTANTLQSAMPFVNAWQTKLLWDQWVVRNVISEEQNDRRVRRAERVVEERGSDFWWHPDEAFPGG